MFRSSLPLHLLLFVSSTYALPPATETPSTSLGVANSTESNDVAILTGPHPFIHCPNPVPPSDQSPFLRDCQRIFNTLFPRPLAPSSSSSSSSSSSPTATVGPPATVPTFAYWHHYPFFGASADGGNSPSRSDITRNRSRDDVSNFLSSETQNLESPGDSKTIYTLPQKYSYRTCEASLAIPDRLQPKFERATWSDIRAAAVDLARTCGDNQRRALLSGGYVMVGEHRRLILEVTRNLG